MGGLFITSADVAAEPVNIGAIAAVIWGPRIGVVGDLLSLNFFNPDSTQTVTLEVHDARAAAGPWPLAAKLSRIFTVGPGDSLVQLVDYDSRCLRLVAYASGAGVTAAQLGAFVFRRTQ